MDNIRIPEAVAALLISSSRRKPLDYFQHAKKAIQSFLGEPNPDKCVTFVPYARVALNKEPWDCYAKNVRDFFESIGHRCISVHDYELRSAKDRADFFSRNHSSAVFVGGGNTYNLLHEIREHNLDETIASAVKDNGLKYIGSSAGTVFSCPTIMTTNDNMIVVPRGIEDKGLNSLGLIPVQIKPHYSTVPLEGHNGETHEERVREYHIRNSTPVIGLTEGAWLRVDGSRVVLCGVTHGYYLQPGKPPEIWGVNTTRRFS